MNLPSIKWNLYQFYSKGQYKKNVGSGFKGSEVPFFALRASQGKQGSAQPLAKKTAGQIEKETPAWQMSNVDWRMSKDGFASLSLF